MLLYQVVGGISHGEWPQTFTILDCPARLASRGVMSTLFVVYWHIGNFLGRSWQER